MILSSDAYERWFSDGKELSAKISPSHRRPFDYPTPHGQAVVFTHEQAEWEIRFVRNQFRNYAEGAIQVVPSEKILPGLVHIFPRSTGIIGNQGRYVIGDDNRVYLGRLPSSNNVVGTARSGQSFHNHRHTGGEDGIERLRSELRCVLKCKADLTAIFPERTFAIEYYPNSTISFYDVFPNDELNPVRTEWDDQFDPFEPDPERVVEQAKKGMINMISAACYHCGGQKIREAEPREEFPFAIIATCNRCGADYIASVKPVRYLFGPQSPS